MRSEHWRLGLALVALLLASALFLVVVDRDTTVPSPAVPSAAAKPSDAPSVGTLAEDELFSFAETERVARKRRLLKAFYSLAEPGGRKGEPPYAEFVAGLDAENLPLFLALLDEIAGSSYVTERARLQRAIVLQWAGFDRPEALRYAMGLPSRTRNNVLGALVVSWAQADREAAWSYVAGTLALHAGDPDLNVVAELLASASYRDPEWALARLASLPAGRAAEQAAAQVFAAQAAIDVERAKAWLDRLPPALHDHALHSILLHYGASDPQRALDAFADLSLPPEKINRSAARLTGVWAAESPALVATWVDEARESPLFPTVASTLAERWSYEDIGQAQQWLAAHRDDAAYLPALKSHLAVLAAQNPAATRPWIDSIRSAGNRGALLAELERLGLPEPASSP